MNSFADNFISIVFHPENKEDCSVPDQLKPNILIEKDKNIEIHQMKPGIKSFLAAVDQHLCRLALHSRAHFRLSGIAPRPFAIRFGFQNFVASSQTIGPVLPTLVQSEKTDRSHRAAAQRERDQK